MQSGFYIITANAAMGSLPVNCLSGVMGPAIAWLVRANPVGEQAYVRDLDVEND